MGYVYTPYKTHCKKCGRLFLKKSTKTKLCNDCRDKARNHGRGTNSQRIFKQRIETARRLLLTKKKIKEPYIFSISDQLRKYVFKELKKPNMLYVTTNQMHELYPKYHKSQFNSVFNDNDMGFKEYNIITKQIENTNWKFFFKPKSITKPKNIGYATIPYLSYKIDTPIYFDKGELRDRYGRNVDIFFMK